jgi:hypothetical protein
MSRKSLLKSESAAAIAIAAVLLLGLAFTIISVVKLNYAPEWKIDAERDYSYDAWSSMEDVKTRAEIFTRFMDSNISYPYGLSATVPFSMGGGDVPVFEPSKSNSKLAVNTEKCTMNITLAKHPDAPKTVDCGGITYYSENRQYPNQVFRYENGALILAQGNNSQMKRGPLFNITEDMGNYRVTFNAIDLIGEPESVSSSTSTALRLTGCSIDPVLNSDDYPENVTSFNLSISTRYIHAWTTYFNNTAKDAGFKYGTNYTINSTDDYVCLSFLPLGNGNYSIHVNKTILCAELGRREGGVLSNGSASEGKNIMNLSVWHYFDTISDSNYEQYLDDLKDYGSGVDLSIESTGKKLDGYTPSSNIFPFSLNNNPSELTLKFSNFTAFESKPSSVTLVMIYQPTVNNPVYQNMSVAGKSVPALTGNSRDTWYLYNQTIDVTGISMNNPSDLALYLKIGKENSKYINIDYLAVRLS